MQVIAQLMTEIFLLSGIGAILGMNLGVALARTVKSFLPDFLAAAKNSPDLDGPILAFSLFATAIAALGAGLIPALQTSRPDLAQLLRQGGRGSQGRVRTRAFRNALVSLEVAA